MRQPAKPRPKQPGIQIQVRVQPEQVALLDAWISGQPEPQPTRPEAIRRLLEVALAEAGPKPHDRLIALLSVPPNERSQDELLDVLDETIALATWFDNRHDINVRIAFADYLNAQLAPAPEPLSAPKPGM
jgi:hypothetical protein